MSTSAKPTRCANVFMIRAIVAKSSTISIFEER
jgi:hypothetical protein